MTTFTMLYTPELNVFTLSCRATGAASHRTEGELKTEFHGEAPLVAWLNYAKEHPNVPCDYTLRPE